MDYTLMQDRFADVRLLRYRVHGFESLSYRQKMYIYHLAEAALWGRDILWDQNCRHNLAIRHELERIYLSINEVVSQRRERSGKCEMTNEESEFVTYLKRVWFANGIHHHYSMQKFVPGFSRQWLEAQGVSAELCDVIFNPDILPKRVNQADGEDLVATSACNYYGEGVTQQEAEDFYSAMKRPDDREPVSYGLNSTLVREGGRLREDVWRVGGKYGHLIERIVGHLEAAREYADNGQQQRVIDLLVQYYRTGDLRTFDLYTIEWVKETLGHIDFTNGFTEVYGDPLGLKASWEGYVNYRDIEATQRTDTLSRYAQWFEDHSPVDERFKKYECRGISARVVVAAMLGGDLYPASAIGINLPNSDWVRAAHGSKSVTIGNLTEAYNQASRGSGFLAEFVRDDEMRHFIEQYGDLTDNLHTDLHECLGHGSGRLLSTTDPDALKAYGSTIEEARADLFALYYMADPKMLELHLLPHADAYKANYYTYLLNGLMTQLRRIEPGAQIEEAHMRNRALIAHWVMEHGGCELRRVDNGQDANAANASATDAGCNGQITALVIGDYARLRQLFAELLREVQRIKSEGDYEAARLLVETYGVKVDARLHAEVLTRFAPLNIAPYKGFVNPRYTLVDGDVLIDYDESYADQMLRYSRDYSAVPKI